MQLNQTRHIDLEEGDALLIIDLQNDFLAGGSLAVPGGDSLIPVVNAYISKFQQHRLPIYLTRDWHPPEHGSFVGQGGQWPEHCIAGSNGAEFPSTLTVPETARIVSKGIAADEEGYSAFSAPGFHRQLQEDGVRRRSAVGWPRTIAFCTASGMPCGIITRSICCRMPLPPSTSMSMPESAPFRT